MDIPALADLLRETSDRHDPFEKTHTKHDWWDWYAAYITARQNGSSPDEAADAAGAYMAEVFDVKPL